MIGFNRNDSLINSDLLPPTGGFNISLINMVIPNKNLSLEISESQTCSIWQVVKKLSGEGKGSAEWFTSIGNENSQIVSFVLTCEESIECLEPMCHGVMDRFQQANQPVPKILYVDRGCCRAQGQAAVRPCS